MRLITSLLFLLFFSITAFTQTMPESNKKATKTNAIGIESNKKATKTNAIGIESNKKATKTNATGIESNKKATKTNARGIESNKKAKKTNATGIESNKKATKTNAAAIEFNEKVKKTNATGIESNKKATETNATGIESNKKTTETNTVTIESNITSKVNRYKKNLSASSEFLYLFGMKINDVDVHLAATTLNTHFRQVTNPESDFFTVKFSEALKKALKEELEAFVKEAFDIKKTSENKNVDQQNSDVEGASKQVEDIVGAVNGVINGPGIGGFLNSNPYGAIIQGAIGTISGLVVQIVKSTAKNKKIKLAENLIPKLIIRQKNILSNMNNYSVFFSEASRLDNEYLIQVQATKMQLNLLNIKLQDFCKSFSPIFKELTPNIQRPGMVPGNKEEVNQNSRAITTILKYAINNLKEQDDAFFKTHLEDISNIDFLLKTQALDFYQEYRALKEELIDLNRNYAQHFEQLIEESDIKINSELAKMKINKAKSDLNKKVNDDYTQDQEDFKIHLKKLYFSIKNN